MGHSTNNLPYLVHKLKTPKPSKADTTEKVKHMHN